MILIDFQLLYTYRFPAFSPKMCCSLLLNALRQKTVAATTQYRGESAQRTGPDALGGGHTESTRGHDAGLERPWSAGLGAPRRKTKKQKLEHH